MMNTKNEHAEKDLKQTTSISNLSWNKAGIT